MRGARALAGAVCAGALPAWRRSHCEGAAGKDDQAMYSYGLGLPLGAFAGVASVLDKRGCPSAASLRGGVLAAALGDGSLMALRVGDGTGELDRRVVTKHVGGVQGLALDGKGCLFYASVDGSILRWDWENSPKSLKQLGGVLEGKKVKHIACGSAHCLALDEEGKVFSWATMKGGGSKGVLGRVHSGEDSELTPAAVDLPEEAGRIAYCACGDLHSILLSEDGVIWSFGSDRWLQLGLTETWQMGASHQNKPCEVTGSLKGKRVAQVACGSEHTLAATESGEVFAWGRGKENQLGLESKVFAATVCKTMSGTSKLPSLPVVQIAAGGHCSLVALKDPQSGVSLWWTGRCPAPHKTEILGSDPRTQCRGGDGTPVLALGTTVQTGPEPMGGGLGSSIASWGLLPPGGEVGDGCSSCRVKSKLTEMLAKSKER